MALLHPLAVTPGPAADKARDLLRKLRDEIATVDLRGADEVERGALRLLLGHLELGYRPVARGTA